MKRIAVLAMLILLASTASAQHVVVDPGHGGTDPGGTGNGLEEKDIVLDTAFRLRDLLNADTADTSGGGSWEVDLTRESDVFVGLGARSDYANAQGADRFMSIHSNAFGDPQANGIETFSFAEGGDSANLRDFVQEEMLAAWPLRDRGNKVANFAVLRETAMPAELHELAFITNSEDVLFLMSATERQKAAEAHLRALQRHYGQEAYVPKGNQGFGSLLVTIQSDGRPIAGTQIGIDGEDAGTTGETGTLQIELVAIGSHIVDANAPGYLPKDEAISISEENVTRLNFTLVLVPTEAECAAEPCREGCPEALDPACVEDNDPGGCGCRSTEGDRSTGWIAALLLLMAAGIRRRIVRRGVLSESRSTLA